MQSLLSLQHTPASCGGKDKINRNFEMILKSFRQNLSQNTLLIRLFFNCIAVFKPTRSAITFRYGRDWCDCLPLCSPASATRTSNSRRHFSSSPRDRRNSLKHLPRMLFFVIFHQVFVNNCPASSCLELPDLL